MVELRPLHDRVLIKTIAPESRTSGGLIIPDSAKEKPQEGEVLAVGAGKIMQDGTLRPVDVKVGDRILYSKYAGIQARSGEDDLLLLREDDILAVINKTK